MHELNGFSQVVPSNLQPSSQVFQEATGSLAGKKVGSVSERGQEVVDKINGLLQEELYNNHGVNPFSKPEFNAKIQVIISDANLPDKYVQKLAARIAKFAASLEIASVPVQPSHQPVDDPFAYYTQSPHSQDPYNYDPYQSLPEGPISPTSEYSPNLNLESHPPPSYSPTPPTQSTHLSSAESYPPLETGLSLKEMVDNGIEQGISEYIEQNPVEETEERVLVQGPQKLNHATRLLDRIVHDLLINPDQYQFVKGENEDYLIKNRDGTFLLNAAGMPVSLQYLLRPNVASSQANFNHISFSESESVHLQKHLETAVLNEYLNLDKLQEIVKVDPKLAQGLQQAHLSDGEKAAIQLYTSPENFSLIQKILQGRISEFEKDVKGFDIDKMLKAYLLIGAIGVSAVNKLPDYSTTARFLYRYDRDLPYSMLQNRIQAVKDGGMITTESGYLSSSHTKPADFFKNGNVITLFENCKAKLLEEMSVITEEKELEREVTMPPTQVQWKYYHEFKDENGNVMHLFIARAVTTPTEVSTLPQSHRGHVPERNESNT